MPRRLALAVVAACLSLAAASAPAAAHTRCAGGAGVHHHRSTSGVVKHFCRRRRAHRRCRAGGHHHHRMRGRRAHYCAVRPAKRSPGVALPGPGAPSPAPPVAPAPSPVTPAPAPSAPTAPVAARLQVTTREFSLTFSRPALPAGPAIVELVNRGEDPHDLRIGAAGAVPETPAGERASANVTLAEGAYQLYCSLPGHASLGMSGTLTVTAP